MAGLDLLRRGVRRVGLAGFAELLDDLAVDLGALRLAVRLVRPTDFGALVPVQAEPAQGVQNRGVALLGSRWASVSSIRNTKVPPVCRA
jgi:hypothetical protein